MHAIPFVDNFSSCYELSLYLPCMRLSPVTNWKGEINKDARQQQLCSEKCDARDALGVAKSEEQIGEVVETEMT